MERCGIQYPEIIDLTTQAKDGTVRLILAEVQTLNGHDIPALKRKLDNYLVAAHSRQPPVVIRIDLYAPPDQLVLMFLRQYRSLIHKQSFGFEISLNQQDLAL